MQVNCPVRSGIFPWSKCYTRYSGILPHNNHTIPNTAWIWQQQTGVSEVETRAVLEKIPCRVLPPPPSPQEPILALLSSGLDKLLCWLKLFWHGHQNSLNVGSPIVPYLTNKIYHYRCNVRILFSAFLRWNCRWLPSSLVFR